MGQVLGGFQDQVARRLVLETPQYLSHEGGNHPCLYIKEQHLLYGGFKEKFVHPQHRPLPAQDPWHSLPNRPRLRQFLDYRRPVSIRLQ